MKDTGIVARVGARLARQFVAFAGMGLIGTAAHYSVLLTLVEWIGLGSVAGSAIGFVTGALVNYTLNYHFTFRSTAPHGVALPRFMTVAAVGFCLNTLCMLAGTRWTSLHYLVVQVLATGAVLLWGFTANLLWTFKGGEHDRDQGRCRVE